MSLAVVRKPGYYILNVLLPVQLLCLLSLGAFLVPVHDVADRLSVSLTMVLTTGWPSAAGASRSPVV